MNWLGMGVPSFLTAVLGALLGALLHVYLRAHGIDFPPLVGILAGVGAALPSRERSGLRGMVVASLAVWTGALAEVLSSPKRGFVLDLAHFSERLGPLRFLGYVACAVVTIPIASRALRPSARARLSAGEPTRPRS